MSTENARAADAPNKTKTTDKAAYTTAEIIRLNCEKFDGLILALCDRRPATASQ
jgi:hypothetical protein